MQYNLIVTLEGTRHGILILVDEDGLAYFEVLHAVQFEEQGCSVAYLEDPEGSMDADYAVINAIQLLEAEYMSICEAHLLGLPQELMHLMYALDEYIIPLNNVVSFR